MINSTASAPSSLYLYGSNSSTLYNSTSDTIPLTGATLLKSVAMSYSYNATIPVLDSTPFRYIHVIRDAGRYSFSITLLQIMRPAGSYTGLINGTDYNITTDTSTGKPTITY